MPAECIHQLVEEQAARTPDAEAIVFENESVSYAELNRRANRIAHYLRRLGVGPETLVGICMHRSPDMIAGMLGILKAGGVYVPIDPAYPKARQAYILEDSAAALVVTQEALVDSLPRMAEKLVRLDSERAVIAQESATNPEAAAGPGNLSDVLYTSGSTGRPKGVALMHGSNVAFIRWALRIFTPDELAGVLAGTSICFDLSIFEIFVALSAGGTVILAENAIALPSIPARNRVTLINTVPSAMMALLQVGGVPGSVRTVVLAGEILTSRLVRDCYALPHIEKVWNGYGPSEDTTYSLYFLCEREATKNPPVGIPVDGTQAYIVNDKLQPVEPGTPGELCLGGIGLARGYLNRPELTEEKFVPNPFGTGRLYRTGDLVRLLPDGNIDFMGRMDHQVKVRGFRVELGEIEVVLEQHPAVDRAVVLAQPDARGELRLLAYVRPTHRSSGESREHLALWRNVYEDAYRKTPIPDDLSFHTASWNSSYTGEPFPPEEMREWLDATTANILDLQPRNVLELGCGTGMIVARVAPYCERYAGFDISPTALDNIRAMQKAGSGLERVELYERAADELSGLKPGFDTVIINSVVQHFPDSGYLTQVLEGALQLVKPSGHIWVGDVISLPLQQAFHTSVQMYRAAQDDTCADVTRRIARQMAQERDLVLAPGFFLAMAERYPAITHVRILPKRGRIQNQLTRFRYDVVLHVGAPVDLLSVPEWIDWRRGGLTLDTMRSRVAAGEILAIRNIRNARLQESESAVSWLADAAPGQSVGEFRRQPNLHAGVDPEDLWALAAEGYSVELSWVRQDSHGSFDAVIGPADQPRRFSSFGSAAVQELANHPQRAKLQRELIPQLREFVRERLPNFMEPAVFTLIDRFPNTPTGKVDRLALSRIPVAAEPQAAQAASSPASPLEKLLLDVWSDVLGVTSSGKDDNFFTMGGNSLSAMALIHRLQRLLHRPFRPVALFHAPTVAEFARYLEKNYPGLEIAPVPVSVFEEGEI